MPRIARNLLQEKKIFHIMVQGINKEKIFKLGSEKRKYIKLIKENLEEYEINLISYCVMTNHVHLLVYSENISSITQYMHNINTNYAIFYNKSHNRVGYVYRDRYKIQVIRDKKHLYNCILYIHNNPVKAKICSKAKDYNFSSYHDFFSIEKPGEINELFMNKIEYESAHEVKNMVDMTFLDDEESIDFNVKNEIEDFLINKSINVTQMKYEKVYLYEIVKKLKNVYNLSNRKISEYLEVSKEKVKYILK